MRYVRNPAGILVALFLITILALFLGNNWSPFSENALANPVSEIDIDLSLMDLDNHEDPPPINKNDILIFASRMNKVAQSLNRAIKKANLDLPTVRLYESSLSYKVPGRSWIRFQEDLIVIYLYQDVASVLTINEVQAVAVHELGHKILGHIRSPGHLLPRNIQEEKDADKFAVELGIQAKFLISAIEKLGEEASREKIERIAILETY